MHLSVNQKDNIKDELVKNLLHLDEIYKIVIFGSFVDSDSPEDIDIAIFQNSHDNYLNLALKYRKALRKVSKIIPLDIIPITNKNNNSFLSDEIENGEVIFERGN